MRDFPQVGRCFSKAVRTASWLLVFLLGTSEFSTAVEKIDYEKQIKPIFTARCIACHGVLKQEAGLRLDTGILTRKGGTDGAVVIPHDAAGSRLLARVSAQAAAERMPAEGEALKPEQIAAIRTWIAEGANSPADEAPEQDPRDHWAFRPIIRPKVPEPSEATWAKNPIDHFIAARLAEKKLIPQVPATKREQIRRLYFDLLGVPPSLAELEKWEVETEPNWQRQLAETLLADPRHGERWGRHWMDVWRYSD